MPQEQQLEFRGINLDHLQMYFVELGGQQVTNSFPIVYEGPYWQAQILSEDELFFTKIFKVNTVQIVFGAQTQEQLDTLIKNYRYKTTRIGG